jgi:thiosulfate dehydrogenase
MKFTGTLAASTLVGALLVGGTLWKRGPDAELTDLEEYGEEILEHTTAYLGPDVADPAMRYAGNRLACGSCHLGAGAEPGTLSLATAIERYPRNSPRSGGKETIEDRINGCMTRSMAGKPLPEDSREMRALVAYLRRLAERNGSLGPSLRSAAEPPEFKTPPRKADLGAGERVFAARCAACHQKDGQGLPASADIRDGFLFPPLWGPNSFNDGAGMHRVLTAARFIKARMPLGNPTLTDAEAFDVAAFINAQPRPHMEHLDQDYPDKTKKPVDAPFPPFADPFPLEQHQFGPFQPIEAFYKKK